MKYLKKILAKLSAPFLKLGKKPDYDWYFTLVCFAIGLILMLAVNSFIFLKLSSSDGSEEAPNTVPTVKLNREDITKTIREMKQRDEDASTLSDKVLEDPSL